MEARAHPSPTCSTVNSTSPSWRERLAPQQADGAAVLAELREEPPADRDAVPQAQVLREQQLRVEFPQSPAARRPADKVDVVVAVARQPELRSRKPQPQRRLLQTLRRVVAEQHREVRRVVVVVELLQRRLRRRHRFFPERHRPRRTPIRNCLFTGFPN